MVVATGIGSMPGTDPLDAMRQVADLLPDFPHLVELPSRGPGAEMIGRAAAAIQGLGFDLQPAGWRLAGAAGIDQRRARSFLGQDLDALEEVFAGYSGPLKIQIAGPWTLAATIELPRGGKVLGDQGAQRELAQGLTAAVAEQVAEVTRRVEQAEVVVQIDEPSLPAVLAGRVHTASGLYQHRSVDFQQAVSPLRELIEQVQASGARSVVHCCGPRVPIDLVREAGAGAVSVDMITLGPAEYDALGRALDEQVALCLGVIGYHEQGSKDAALRRAREGMGILGVDLEEISDYLVFAPACGLSGSSSSEARGLLEAIQSAAKAVGA